MNLMKFYTGDRLGLSIESRYGGGARLVTTKYGVQIELEAAALEK